MFNNINEISPLSNVMKMSSWFPKYDMRVDGIDRRGETSTGAFLQLSVVIPSKVPAPVV
jgi:hypothetical protein